jgi:hypothetical protein
MKNERASYQERAAVNALDGGALRAARYAISKAFSLARAYSELHWCRE